MLSVYAAAETLPAGSGPSNISMQDASLLAILASIMLFIALVNNLYKIQIIDEIRVWVEKLEDDFRAHFDKLQFKQNKDNAKDLLTTTSGVFKKSLLWNQYYNIGAAIYWLIIVICWLFYKDWLTSRNILLTVYIVLFLASAFVYIKGMLFNSEKEIHFENAKTICLSDDKTMAEAKGIIGNENLSQTPKGEKF